MQPSDTQPPKKEKVGFWARLFGKKPKETLPTVPPHGSQTPQPQLGNDEPVTDPTAPAATAEPNNLGVPTVGVDSSTPGVGVSDVPPQAPPVDPGVPPVAGQDVPQPPVGGTDGQRPVQ